MTIKRRLFISNIMMLVIPVIIGIIIITAMILAIMGIFNINFEEWFEENEHFIDLTVEAQAFTEKWTQDVSLEQIKTDIDGIRISDNEDYKNISLAVFQNRERLYSAGDFEDTPLLPNALAELGGNYFIMNNICLYALEAGDYKIVLMDTEYTIRNELLNPDDKASIKTLVVLLFIAVIIIILATNRYLTRKNFKSIITPLDMLVYGVHQIRDGNLSYRIEYDGKDEFNAVCSDFNEMAERLLDMVNSRQKDEENRKELIAGISHDLRTPLTSIMTYVEGIEIGLATTPQTQKHYLDTIKNKAKDLEHIVNQLFLLSKLDIGEFPMQMKQIDIGKWLTNYVGNATDEYTLKGLRIELEVNTKNTAVNADSIQLGNVLTNILENSLKYNDKEQAVVRIDCKLDSSNVVITLSDNGPGVPDEALEKLFHMFYRGDKARSKISQGSGLGLAISARIVERFGGGIKAANMPECGLSIIVTLPIVKGVKE